MCHEKKFVVINKFNNICESSPIDNKGQPVYNQKRRNGGQMGEPDI